MTDQAHLRHDHHAALDAAKTCEQQNTVMLNIKWSSLSLRQGITLSMIVALLPLLLAGDDWAMLG